MRKYLLGFACVGVASGLQAQTVDSMQVEDVPSLKRTAIEINPASAVLSAVPGVGAISGTIEAYLGDKWAGFVELGYADIDLDNRWIQTAEEETGEPIVQAGDGYMAGLGLRYYEDPIGDSLYAAGLVTYSEGNAKWEYEDVTVSSEVFTVSPSLAAGYRWVWNSGVLVRLGAGASTPFLVGENISGAGGEGAIEEARTKISDIQDQQILAKVDLGLGYTF